MLIAIVTVHFDKGLFMANNGYEFGLALLVISVALVFSDAGRFSVDRTLSRSSKLLRTLLKRILPCIFWRST